MHGEPGSVKPDMCAAGTRTMVPHPPREGPYGFREGHVQETEDSPAARDRYLPAQGQPAFLAKWFDRKNGVEKGTATAGIAGLPCVIGRRRFDSAG